VEFSECRGRATPLLGEDTAGQGSVFVQIDDVKEPVRLGFEPAPPGRFCTIGEKLESPLAPTRA
jgi:hypothetical protein